MHVDRAIKSTATTLQICDSKNDVVAAVKLNKLFVTHLNDVDKDIYITWMEAVISISI